jgi:hypothetical protein
MDALPPPVIAKCSNSCGTHWSRYNTLLFFILQMRCWMQRQLELVLEAGGTISHRLRVPLRQIRQLTSCCIRPIIHRMFTGSLSFCRDRNQPVRWWLQLLCLFFSGRQILAIFEHLVTSVFLPLFSSITYLLKSLLQVSVPKNSSDGRERDT